MASIPWSQRLVEVIADLGPAGYRYGSGCVVAGKTVLTAAHVITGAVAVTVRDVGKRSYLAVVDAGFVGDSDGPGPDLALIRVDSLPGDGYTPLRLGRVVRDSPVPVAIQDCHAFGYPGFAESSAPVPSRDSVQAIGVIPALSKLTRGLLSMVVSIEPAALSRGLSLSGESPWSGMSGGPVVAEDRLLGVVVEHSLREGSSAITIEPLTALEADPVQPHSRPGVPDPAAWWRRLAVEGPADLHPIPTRSPTPEIAETQLDELAALMRGQVRAADRLPSAAFGTRRRLLSQMYVRPSLFESATPNTPRQQLEEVLTRHRHLLLTGGPGQGKSTLTLQLVRKLAGDHLADGSAGTVEGDAGRLVPLRVTGRQLAGRVNLPWLAALAQAATAELGVDLDLGRDLSGEVLGRAVAGSQWLIVIDGLDEVATPEQRARLLSTLATRLADPDEAHRLMITSRPLPAHELATLRGSCGDELGVYELVPFDATAVQQLAGRWLAVTPDTVDTAAALRFMRQVRQTGLTEMVAVPLLAMIAMILFEQDPEQGLPSYRFDLYERYLDGLLTTAERAPEWAAVCEAVTGVADTGASVADGVEALLQHLATAELAGDADLATAARQWLRARRTRFRRVRTDLDVLIEALFTRTGLIRRRSDRWEFIHQSFAEHLAATATAVSLPDRFDPDAAPWRECLASATESSRTLVGPTALLAWCRQADDQGHALLDWLQAGAWEQQQLAAMLLATGAPGKASHVQTAIAQVQRRILFVDEGQPVGLLSALARSHHPALETLDHVAQNPIVPIWARADALAATIRLRNLSGDQTARTVRPLLAERRAHAGWSHVIAAAELLDLGVNHRAEAIDILRGVLTDPHAHPNARENAALTLASNVAELRSEAEEALRSILLDPLAALEERHFAGRGLASLGFVEEVAEFIDATLAEPDVDAGDKMRFSILYATLPSKYRSTATAAYRQMLDDKELPAADRAKAARALVRVAPALRAQAVAALREILPAVVDDAAARVTVADSLGQTAPDLRDTVAAELGAVLGDDRADSWVRADAAQAMARLNVEDPDRIITTLSQIIRGSEDPRQRAAAGYALVRLGSDLHDEGLDALRAAMNSADIDLAARIDAAGVLGQISANHRAEVAAALAELVADPGATGEDRLAAAVNLLALDASKAADAKAGEWLRAVLADTEVDTLTRLDAADELVQLRTPHRQAAIDALRSIIHDATLEDDVRIWAMHRLAKCGDKLRAEAMAAAAGLASEPDV